MNFENTIIYELLQTSTTCRTNLQRAMNEIELHSGQIFVLIALWKSDGQSQIDLAKNLSLAAPTIHKMIKSLIKSDFVESRKCDADNRMMRVYLTDKGRQYETPALERWEKLEARMFANLTETEKLILSQIFGKLKSDLGNSIPVVAD